MKIHRRAVGETIHRGNVGILNFKAYNQITAGRNGSKVSLFWEETNLLNVTWRKLLLSLDRNICGKGKSILHHKGNRKGHHIDVQPTIKKRGSSPRSPWKLKPEKVTSAIRNENSPEKELTFLSFPMPRPST